MGSMFIQSGGARLAQSERDILIKVLQHQYSQLVVVILQKVLALIQLLI